MVPESSPWKSGAVPHFSATSRVCGSRTRCSRCGGATCRGQIPKRRLRRRRRRRTLASCRRMHGEAVRHEEASVQLEVTTRFIQSCERDRLQSSRSWCRFAPSPDSRAPTAVAVSRVRLARLTGLKTARGAAGKAQARQSGANERRLHKFIVAAPNTNRPPSIALGLNAAP